MRRSHSPLPAPSDAAVELDARIANARPLIVQRADLQTAAQRWGYRSLTLICWAFWVYLFLPLISVVAWAAGLTWAYVLLIQGLELVELWALLKSYGSGIGTLGGVYLVWAVTSYLRFRRVERRQLAPSIADDLMASSHRLTRPELVQLRSAGRQVVPPDQLARMFASDVPPEEESRGG